MERYCPNCGQKIIDDSVAFCTNCGFQLNAQPNAPYTSNQPNPPYASNQPNLGYAPNQAPYQGQPPYQNNPYGNAPGQYYPGQPYGMNPNQGLQWYFYILIILFPIIALFPYFQYRHTRPKAANTACYLGIGMIVINFLILFVLP